MKFVVAFSSPKRSAMTVERAAAHAKALNADVVLLRIVPDPEKVGVIAQLISTDRPLDKATKQVESVAAKLRARGINATGIVKIGAVAKTIASAAQELGADLLFVGTADAKGGGIFMMKSDPIVKYLVEHCPVNLMLVRTPLAVYESDDDGDDADSPIDLTETAEAIENPPAEGGASDVVSEDKSGRDD
jgi:nucleotide-binding universal stress UspA family protein